MDLDDQDVRMRGLNDDDHDEDDVDILANLPKRKHMDEDDEDEEDDEEEDEEDDEQEGDRGHSSRKAKRRRRDAAINPFIDVQAIVDDDDDDDDEEDEAEIGFVQYQQQDEDDEDVDERRAAAHARLDRQRLHEEELSGEELAKRLRARYAQRDQMVEELASVPQRMLMPSVNDPNLWQVKVKPGRERDIVLNLFRKTLDFEAKGKPLQIISVFERESIQGYIYVESRSKEAVITACANLIGVYRRDPILIPINEMAPLLQLKKKEITIAPGAWVRLKRGKYQGDLAQVVDMTDTGEEVGIRFLPRIDMNPKESEIGMDGKTKRKRVAHALGRPPARHFNPEEVLRVHGKKHVVRKGPSWIFQGDTYTDGFMEKDVRVSALVTENVNPTLDELSVFLGQGKDGNQGSAANLEALAEAVRKPTTVALQPGDHVEVYQGEQNGAQGVVDSVLGDVVLIRGTGLELEGQMIEVPSRYVRKRFTPGDHVKVMSGQNTDETGMVVSVKGDLITFISDLTETEITVFSKDLRTAAEVGSSSNVVGNYELHDLVQLDMHTAGVIYRTERDSFRVLDQNGQTRLVKPHQITMRRDSRRVVSTDSEGNELRVGDNVKEIDGEGRRGVVLHIHQAIYAFLHNREIVQDGGIFVTRCRSLAPIAPKGAPKPGGMDLTKMNPAVAGGMGGAPSMSRGPRDKLIGTIIKIIKGTQKGYQGVIKDVNGQQCRIELSTNNKIISIEKDKLRRVGANGQLEPLEGPGGFVHPGQARGVSGTPGGWGSTGGRTPNPYNSDGGRTPGWGASGRTPNPYGSNRTPAWTAGTTTPNPYLDGGKTPAWNVSSRTPNPYNSGDGNKTPAWGASSRTPNPYNSGGNKTPAWESGSKTPNTARAGSSGWGSSGNRDGDSWGASNDGWGSSSNKRNGSSNDKNGWGSSRDSHDDSDWGQSAPTPAASAPTPYLSAPTPYASAPTPYASAPTPAVSAPTPAAYSAETPAPYSAPTPGVYSAPTPGTGYTPAGYAPTPRGVAQTPAAAQDYVRTVTHTPFRVDNERWLLEFNIPNICAQFREDTGFADGEYDKRAVVVTHIKESQPGIEHTAHVKFLDDNTEFSGAPIKYLQPLYPFSASHQNSHAILLQDHVVNAFQRGAEVSGAKKEKVLLRTFGDQEWLCGRVQVPGAADIEVPATELCLIDE